MKRLILVSLVLLASLAAVPSALSGRPTIERTQVDEIIPDFVDCAFPVEIHIIGTDTAITRTVGGDIHEFHAFGGGFATVTNVITHTSVTVNIAGPGHLTFGADGSFSIAGTGTAIFFFEETPGIEWVLGRWVFAIDAAGNESFTLKGTSRDLCAEVA